MKTIPIITAFLAVAATVVAENVALVGGTVINPSDGRTIENAVVIVDGDRIQSVGSGIDTKLPAGSRSIDCAGKFILPGYIDTHVVDKDHPVDAFRPTARATIEESHAHKIRVAVHATELETARAAVEEGADILVHSVVDKPVDDAFVKLLQDRHIILCPTLVVFERYGRTFSHQLNLTPEEKAWGNPEVIASLDVTKIPADKLPDRIKEALAKPDEAMDRIKKVYDVALPNLKRLEDAGVTIAAGTDAGNIGTIHGPALFREFQLMKEAGLTPMQILKCATTNAAQLFGGETGARIGKIDNGCLADLVILKSNPAEDISHASDIDTVIKNGVVYPAESILK